MSEKRKGDDLLAEGRNKFARVDGGDAFGGDGDVERSPEVGPSLPRCAALVPRTRP